MLFRIGEQIDKNIDQNPKQERIPAMFATKNQKLRRNFSSEPQSIIEFYCDDDFTNHSQWGFLTNQDEESYFEEKLEENLFFSMTFIDSLS